MTYIVTRYQSDVLERVLQLRDKLLDCHTRDTRCLKAKSLEMLQFC